MPAVTVARAPRQLELPALEGLAGRAHLARNCAALDRTLSRRPARPFPLVDATVVWCRHCAATAELMAATAPAPGELGPADTLVAVTLPAPTHRSALVFSSLPTLPTWPLQLDPDGAALAGTRGWVLVVPATTAGFLTSLRAFNPPWVVESRRLPDGVDPCWLRALTAGLLDSQPPHRAVSSAWDLAALERQA